MDKPTIVGIVGPTLTSERDKEWITANVQSISEVVQFGSHDVLYYPACGSDVLRVVVAYDVTRLICLDTDPGIKNEIERQLQALGLEYTLKTKTQGETVFSFTLNGKNRVINFFEGDARKLTFDKLGIEKVDILHIFLPTGADQPIRADEAYYQEKYGSDWFVKRWDSEAQQEMQENPNGPKPDPTTGKYAVVFPAISASLNEQNYQQVKEGGFFVFAERSLQADSGLPSVFQLMGLKEFRITRRHPFSVATSTNPSDEEVAAMNQAGFIYQKERVINPTIVEIVIEILENQQWVNYGFAEFERGNFDFMGVGKNTTVDVAFMSRYKELRQTADNFAAQLTQAGANEDGVQAFLKELLENYRQKVEQLQTRARDVRQKHSSVLELVEIGQLDTQGVMNEFGLIGRRNRFGMMEYPNTDYLLAAQLVLGTEEKKAETLAILEQLADARFDWDTP